MVWEHGKPGVKFHRPFVVPREAPGPFSKEGTLTQEKSILATIALLGLTVVVLCTSAAAQTEKVLHSFNYAQGDGYNPQGLLVLHNGNLYGTTYWGGTNHSAAECRCGTVFQLQPNGDGSWTESLLRSFNLGAFGAHPIAPVVFDSQGNLYGVAETSGNGYGDGVVFELSPGSGTPWPESLVATFNGANGAGPDTGLAQDNAGHIYGTAASGGADDSGVAFSIGNGAGNGAIVLYSFGGRTDGSNPLATLTADANGNLYGTAQGGPDDGGIVFELSRTQGSAGWTKTTLYSFTNVSGPNNPSSLAFGPDGSLYGTAGGGAYQYGAIFKLTPDSDGSWTESTIYNFLGPPKDGGIPQGPLAFDSAGNIYGATGGGGEKNWGIVFELTPAGGGQWSETILYTFSGGADGANPSSGVLRDQAGNLYGTTINGGQHKDWGVVYEVSP
jgi:uncharacterized repeat protein (TIGR03803 family)